MADAALHRSLEPVHPLPLVTVSKQDVLALAESLPLRHGSAKAVAALTFADGRADRPGESISRVNMFVAGLPIPELQVELRGASGKKYTVDTYWREFDKIGEFDGRYKYTDPRFMNGRTAEQVVLDEKAREDDLRAAGHGFTRWPWSIAVSPERLSEHLRRAGIR